MQLAMHHTMRDERTGAEPARGDREVNLYSYLAARARVAPRGALASMAAGAGVVAVAAVLLGAGHWMLLTACYLVWSYAVWGLVIAPHDRESRAWRALEIAVVTSDTILAAILLVGIFYLALGPRWML